MTILALAGAVLALVACGVLLRRLGTLRRALEAAEVRLGRRLYRIQGRLAELESQVQELEFERRRASGQIRIDPGMTIEEAFAIHPRVREILGSFGITGGGCAGGSLDEGGSIAQACATASVDSRAVVDSLRRFVSDPRSAPAAGEALGAKLYRIERAPGK